MKTSIKRLAERTTIPVDNGRFIADNIAGPLGVDFFLGVPASQDQRVAEMTEGPMVYDGMTKLAQGPYSHGVFNPKPTASAPISCPT